jgi:hypothetical protein
MSVMTATQKNLTVSIHIPKTAGTTVAEIFSRCFRRSVIFDYDGYSNPFVASDLIVRHAEFINKYFNVLHGHFYAKKYFNIFPNAAFVATLRHPVDRVISQFMHEFNEHSDDAFYHKAIQNGEMDIVDFAAEPGVGDAMSLHLSGRPLHEYDLLIISEELRKSMWIYSVTINNLHLDSHFGQNIDLPRANEGVARANSIGFDEKMRAAIFDRTQPDNAVYAEAVSLLNQKAQEYL